MNIPTKALISFAASIGISLVSVSAEASDQPGFAQQDLSAGYVLSLPVPSQGWVPLSALPGSAGLPTVSVVAGDFVIVNNGGSDLNSATWAEVVVFGNKSGEGEVETYTALNSFPVLAGPVVFSDNLGLGTYEGGVYTPDRVTATGLMYAVPEPSTYLAGLVMLIPLGRGAFRVISKRKVS